MNTSQNGLNFIAKEEGNILYAYDDYNSKRVNVGDSVRGTITIGVGHTSAAGAPQVVPGMVISDKESKSILANDLKKVEAEVNKLVKVSINQNQFDALDSFQFNTGGLGRSQVLAKLNKGDYKGAADAFLNWTRANGNPTLLLPRRQRERALFLTPAATGGATATAAGTVIAGGVVAATTPTQYWPAIVAVTFVVAILGYIAYTVYEYRKQKPVTNVG